MSRRARRWTIAIVLLLVLPVACLALAPTLVRPDRFRPRIEALVAEQTGRALVIDGPIRIGWSPRPTVSISGVRLANLPGGSRPDMVTVERIDARLSLPALLRWRVVVSRLTLIGPNILLEPVGGQPNWVFQPQPGRSSPAPGSPRRRGPSLFVSTAHIQNGMVTFHFPERTNVIGVRTLDYAHPLWSEPLRLDAVLVYRDFQPFTVHATSTPTGGTLDPWSTHLDARFFDAVLQADGSTSLAGPFDLSLSLRAPALEKLNLLLPSMRLPALHGMTLSTRLSSPAAGVLPVPGLSSLRVASADLGDRLPGLVLSDLSLDLPSPGGIASLRSNGRFRSQPFSLRGTVDMPTRLGGRTAAAATLLATTTTSPAVTQGGDTIGLRGTISMLDGAFDGFNGSMALRAAALASFRSISSPAMPALTALSVDGNVAVPGRLDRIALDHLLVRSAEGDLDGKASIGLGDAAPDATAELHSRRLVLDALLPGTSGSRATPSMQEKLPWSSLRSGALDLSWQADHLGFRGQDWPDLRLHAILKGGTLTVDLPVGLLQGRLAVQSGAAAPVPVRLALRADAFPLRPLFGLAGLPSPANDPVSGTLRMALDVSAHGDTPQALLDTAQGTMALSVIGAAMSEDTLSAVAAPALKQLGARPPPDHHVTVGCFGLHGAIADGMLDLSRIALDTGGLVLSGAGRIDLAHDTLALRLHPLARLAGSRVSVPVVVDGPFKTPSVRLDAGGMDKVGLLLDALFGGDHPKPCRDAGLAG